MRLPTERPVVAIIAAVAVAAVAVGCGGSSSENTKSNDKGKGDRSESPQQFLDKLDDAVHKGDTDFRVARLHPVVIQRYGEQQCRDFLAGPLAPADPSRADKVKRVDKPRPFVFSTDDGGIPVPNGQLLIVKETFQKKTTERELHLARVDGEYRYFIDCGTPVPQP